jgi:hypothetical protein
MAKEYIGSGVERVCALTLRRTMNVAMAGTSLLLARRNTDTSNMVTEDGTILGHVGGAAGQTLSLDADI